MHRFLFARLHRWTRWVLAAWWCVAVGTALSPLALAQAGMWEPVCGMAAESHRVPSPAAQLLGLDETLPLPHGLDCPLCLPLLVPPPAGAHPLPLQPMGAVHAAWQPTAPWVYRVAAPLPARGPPQPA